MLRRDATSGKYIVINFRDGAKAFIKTAASNLRARQSAAEKKAKRTVVTTVPSNSIVVGNGSDHTSTFRPYSEKSCDAYAKLKGDRSEKAIEKRRAIIEVRVELFCLC